MSQDEGERRRRSIINAVAIRYYVFLDPALLDALLSTGRDPVEVVGRVVGNMREGEIVLTIDHFEVR